MKRTLYVCALALMIFACGTALAQSSDQDMVAAARKARNQQKKAAPSKVWTNDDIASTPAPAPKPTATSDAAAGDAANADAAKTDAAKDANAKPDEAAKPAAADEKTKADEQAKAAAEMQQKVDAQKSEIATLSRELDIADREFKLQIANYYADAGNSLRDPAAWVKQRDARQKEINDKKAAIDAAKAKLDDLLEQARKAGIHVNE